MNFVHSIDAKDVLAYLESAGAGLGNAQPFLMVWGQRVAKQARETARGKGGRSFWPNLARSVQVALVSGDAVSVHSRHVAAAQKQFGGVIEINEKRALTIPVSAEARGKKADEFKKGGRKLFVLPSRSPDTVGVLGYAEKADAFHALFVLRRRTRRQAAEPWFPGDAAVAAMGLDEAERWVAGGLKA